MVRLALLASIMAATLSRCGEPPVLELPTGGLYVAYNAGCEEGCDAIQRGDVILGLDGLPTSKPEDLDGLTDGRRHDLVVYDSRRGEQSLRYLVADAAQRFPPLEDAPPLWVVGVDELRKAPQWAQRRLFSRASPAVAFAALDGGIANGRMLVAQKRLMVYFDQGSEWEEATARVMLQVLQNAQADLNAHGVEVMMVHMRFPGGRRPQMTDTALRRWQRKWTLVKGGDHLPEVPVYRGLNETEYNPMREVGVDAYTVVESLGVSPAIVLLDDNGIVRWHSEGVQDPRRIGSAIRDPIQATIIHAVRFALREL